MSERAGAATELAQSRANLDNRTFYLFLLAIIVLGALFRFIWWGMNDYLPRDSYFYIAEVKRIIDSGDWSGLNASTSGIPPLLIIVMLAGEYTGTGAMAAGLGLALGASIALPLAAAWLGCLIFKQRVYALIAAFILATTGEFIRHSPVILRDMPYLLAVIIAAACFITAAEKRQIWLWAAGTAAGICAVMLRKEGLEVFAALGVWAILPVFRGEYASKWREVGLRLLIFTVITVAALAILFPIQLKLQEHGLEWEAIPVAYFKEIMRRVGLHF